MTTRHRYGVPRAERRTPLGHAMAAMGALARSDVLDRVGIRRGVERAVFTGTRSGFRTATAVSRGFARRGGADRAGTRARPVDPTRLFDLTPTEDQQQLLAVVTELAAELVRPAAAAADDACAAPAEVLAACDELGLSLLGVPEALGGIAEERSAVTGTLVAEALAHGDMGLAVAALAPGAVATALSLWGTDRQQQTYLAAFTGADVPVAALALTETGALFDALQPGTTAVRTDDGFRLDGVKSMVPRGCDAELFVVGASLDGRPALFLVESSQEGLGVRADPSMGLRAAGLSSLRLDGVAVGPDALLGDDGGAAYVECLRLSRLAWCALAVGTGQAVLDHVTPYVKERQAFGEPIAHRQAVAFMVADMAIEIEAMRLLTWRAASRASTGAGFAREVALARQLCADKGMRIGLDGVQLLGGHGFVKDHPVERWYRDLRAVALVEGGVLV